jgi:hypothetical protein
MWNQNGNKRFRDEGLRVVRLALIGCLDFSISRLGVFVFLLYIFVSPDVIQTGELGTRKLREADTLQM